ncbi:MAG: hypothetical protein Q9227_004323 [Pyrenula ochraceoflavens]
MGGVGKTQLALKFVQLHQKTYDSVFWLDGSSRDKLQQSIQEGLCRLEPSQLAADALKALESKEDISAAVRGFQRWLETQENSNWLLVFDSVDLDPFKSNKNSAAYDVKEYLPSANHGSILITSRLDRWAGSVGERLPLDRVTDEQARQILRKTAEKEVTGANKVIKILDGLPLALTLAGTYMRLASANGSEYVESYKEEWHVLMKDQELFGEEQNGQGSVLTAWTLSYEQVKSQSEAAAGLLRLWAFFDNKDVFPRLLKGAADVDDHIPIPKWLKELATSNVQVRTAFACLSRFSLVEDTKGRDSKSMHPVLHKWCHFKARQQADDKQLSLLATAMVATAIPSNSEKESSELCRRLRQHANRSDEMINMDALVELGDLKHSEYTSWLYWQLGTLFERQCELDKAERMHGRALDECIRAGTEDDRLLPLLYYSQGNVCYRRGKYDAAEELFKKALEQKRATPNANLTDLDLYVGFGNLYSNRGDLAAAENSYRQALSNLKEEDGSSKTVKLYVTHNLGQVFALQGKLTKARHMYEKTLQGKLRLLGSSHESTLQTRNNLGYLYVQQGKLRKAEEMLIPALKDAKNALRERDHLKLEILDSVGYLYKEQNKYQEAEEMFKQALNGFKLYFKKHPSESRIQENLNSVQQLIGKRKLDHDTWQTTHQKKTKKS